MITREHSGTSASTPLTLTSTRVAMRLWPAAVVLGSVVGVGNLGERHVRCSNLLGVREIRMGLGLGVE